MILGVPNDLNCAHVLVSALRMGITTASTELMHNITVCTAMGLRRVASVTQLVKHGHALHLARAAST